MWWDAYLEPLVRPLTEDLRTMIESYELLSVERKRKVQEYVQEQSELNLLETRREMGEDV